MRHLSRAFAQLVGCTVFVAFAIGCSDESSTSNMRDGGQMNGGIDAGPARDMNVPIDMDAEIDMTVAIDMDAAPADMSVDAPPADMAPTCPFGYELIAGACAPSWAHDTYMKASNPGINARFGRVVSISADGTRLAVAANCESSSAIGVGGHETNNDAPESGAVYVFVKTGSAWSQEAYIKASNTDIADYFGTSISLSADGSRLAIGAPNESSGATDIGGDEDDNSAPNAGAVYVFVRSGRSWSQEAYVKASNAEAGDNFGHSVSLSSDGSLLAVGAPLEWSGATGVGGDEENNDSPTAGAAYVFARTGTSWGQEAYIKASNTDAADRFGSCVSLAADGSHLAVGAEDENSNATGIHGDETNDDADGAGAAYVFVRTGTSWTQQAYVKASNTNANDFFGHSLSLSADGSRLAVSAVGEASNATGVGGDETNNSAAYSGAVYLFVRSGTTWAQEAYIKASNTDAGDGFGRSVALSPDGNRLAIGTVNEASNAAFVGGDETNNDAPIAGAVYVFARADAMWAQEAYVKSSNPEAADHFGESVSFSSDGKYLAVGAHGEDSDATSIGGALPNNDADFAGATYTYLHISE